MQSHASRYNASEHLKDRHPDLTEPFPDGVIPDEIAWAYGRRAVPKLCANLALEVLVSDKRALALRVLLGLLTTQEQKGQAIASGACVSLVTLMEEPTPEVRWLSADVLCALSMLLNGRLAMIAAGAVEKLTEHLLDENMRVRESCTAALAQFSKPNDGAQATMSSPAGVVRALVVLIDDETTTMKAHFHAVSTLCHVNVTDRGIVQSLEAQAVPAVLKLATNPETDEEAMGKCSHCLLLLCQHPDGRVVVLEEGGLPVLTNLMDCGEDCQVAATAGLMGLTVEVDAKVAAIREAGPRLVELLSEANPDVAENALMTIRGACEHPEAFKLAIELMSEDEKNLVFN
mmetsp:Transcript_22766/g.70716  ORF Transcript_22766/g.70716 Transcript_22766/m.70716 type:complete len:345 (+) Transcript_22766:135-1169(+)|eukprot:CAMPEP_0182864096 /NCGR_PEP_ID=MMETSP0034_2-20130328/6994_1 /TAXON_ID=156128 /ORGANISM="Nephroselmis pyriformis, Strain CCMP717" /LENGTH=344 /DNA_ID=CAMNT_0024996345 /DNA_START=134 /DNA_END=1168 /DNA_ORIENTATION=+